MRCLKLLSVNLDEVSKNKKPQDLSKEIEVLTKRLAEFEKRLANLEKEVGKGGLGK